MTWLFAGPNGLARCFALLQVASRLVGGEAEVWHAVAQSGRKEDFAAAKKEK